MYMGYVATGRTEVTTDGCCSAGERPLPVMCGVKSSSSSLEIVVKISVVNCEV